MVGYVTGYILSLLYTLDAYLVVTKHLYGSTHTMLLIAGLAIVQLIVQLVFFLHLGRESKPRWKLVVFGFMLMVLLILVFGSLWIMQNLNYHHVSSPSQVNTYLSSQDGL